MKAPFSYCLIGCLTFLIGLMDASAVLARPQVNPQPPHMAYRVIRPAGHGNNTEEIELTLYGYTFAPGTDPAVGSAAYVRYSLTGYHEDVFEQQHGGETFSGRGIDNNWVYEKDYGMKSATAASGIPENPLPPSDPMHFLVTANIPHGYHLFRIPFQLFNRFGQIMTITTPTPDIGGTPGAAGSGRPGGFSQGRLLNNIATIAPPLIPLVVSHQAGSSDTGSATVAALPTQGSGTVALISITQSGPAFTFSSVTKQLTDIPLGGNLGVQGIQLYPGAEASPSRLGASSLAGFLGTALSSAKKSASASAPNAAASPKVVQPIYFSFTPLTETGPVTDGTALFSGGMFTIYDSTEELENALLTGDFPSSSVYLDGEGSGILTFYDLTYTGGSDLATFLADNPGEEADGSFSINLTGVEANSNTPIPLDGDSFPSFTASGNIGTFNASPVPEPSGALLLLIGSVCLLLLRLRFAIDNARSGRYNTK